MLNHSRNRTIDASPAPKNPIEVLVKNCSRAKSHCLEILISEGKREPIESDIWKLYYTNKYYTVWKFVGALSSLLVAAVVGTALTSRWIRVLVTS